MSTFLVGIEDKNKQTKYKKIKEAEDEKQLSNFNKYNSFTTITENGVWYLCGMKGFFSNKVVNKMESKSFDCTGIIKLKCAHCRK